VRPVIALARLLGQVAQISQVVMRFQLADAQLLEIVMFVVSIIIFSAFVGFMTGFVPARRASKIDPLDALRYK